MTDETDLEAATWTILMTAMILLTAMVMTTRPPGDRECDHSGALSCVPYMARPSHPCSGNKGGRGGVRDAARGPTALPLLLLVYV